MEVLIRNNNLKMEKSLVKVDKLQKTREYLLTELDDNIYKNVSVIDENSVKEYFVSMSKLDEKYEDSYIEYIKNNNCFLIQYYINHKFYKGELYEYKIANGLIYYGCIDYSFEKGGIN
ncbi:hypothetical protein I6U48_19285 [Clostridium sp. PL3]|uniref:Uncharacterized protein n=2 Tax=Clostridium thailandense TaxID=2794346 RepID=A0A949WWP2_9CLOT|nr:hypothetical protein [Clostridium thailandense]MBV7275047.1 hypothetical protein [Clostridium thailandense]